MSIVISIPISSINRSGPIGIPHSTSASSIFSRLDALFEKFGRIEQIGKKHPVHEEARTVPDHDRHLSDLARKGDRAFFRFLGSLFRPIDDFDQLHPADRIEKMQTDRRARDVSVPPQASLIDNAEVLVARMSVSSILRSRSRKISF